MEWLQNFLCEPVIKTVFRAQRVNVLFLEKGCKQIGVVRRCDVYNSAFFHINVCIYKGQYKLQSPSIATLPKPLKAPRVLRGLARESCEFRPSRRRRRVASRTPTPGSIPCTIGFGHYEPPPNPKRVPVPRGPSNPAQTYAEAYATKALATKSLNEANSTRFIESHTPAIVTLFLIVFSASAATLSRSCTRCGSRQKRRRRKTNALYS